MFGLGGAAAHATGTVVVWGSNNAGQTNIPAGLSNVVAVGGGHSYSVALRSDGTVVLWGTTSVTGITPPDLNNIVAIAAGHSHCLALRANGTVVAWGQNSVGQTNVPAGLSGVTAIAAGNGHNVALKNDGTLVAWGSNLYGQTNLPGLSNIVAIGAGVNHSLAVRADGTVAAWGYNAQGQSSVPAGLTDVIAVAGGISHSVALKGDGTIVTWGGGGLGVTNVPAHATNIVAIAANNRENLALRADARIVHWGNDFVIPPPLTNVVAIGVGHFHRLAVIGDDLPFIVRQPASSTTYSGKSLSLNVVARSHLPLSYQWRKNGEDISGATSATLFFASAQAGDSGDYSVRVSDERGSVLSHEAALTVLDRAPVILVEPVSHNAKIGGAVQFEVVTDGSAPLSYQWYFHGTNLPGATSASLLLTNLAASNAGPYFVIAQNSFGAATSVVATLSLGPPIFPGHLDPSFDAGYVDNVVRCVAIDQQGAVLIGGFFQNVGSVGRAKIARFLSDGRLDPSFNPGDGTDGAVYAMAVQADGRIVIAGDFLSMNGVPRQRIARLNPDGSLDPTSFAAPDLYVWAVAIQSDGKILIGGDFFNVAGVPRQSIARLNVDGTLDTSFSSGVAPFSRLRAIALQNDGKVLIGGSFTNVGGVPRGNIARLASNGALDATFAPTRGASDWVYAITIQGDGRILVGGIFNFFNDVHTPYLARLTTDGGLDETFAAGRPSAPVSSIALQNNGQILIAGGFGSVNGIPRGRLARLDVNGQLDTSFESDPGANEWVEAIALQPDGNIIIVGNFTSYDGQPRYRVARVAAADPPPFAPFIVSGPTDRTALEGTHVTFNAFARGSPTPTYQWQHNGTNLLDATSRTLTLRNVRMSNAGTYRVIARNELGEADASATLTIEPAPTTPGSTDIHFYTGVGPNAGVNDLAVQNDGKVLIGGHFHFVDGIVRPGFARLNSDGSLDTGFVPPINWAVNAVIVQPDGRILVGAAACCVPNVVRLLPDGTLDPSFVSGLEQRIVDAMALLPDGRVVVSSEHNIYRLSPTGAVDGPFSASLDGAAYALVPQPDGRVLVGGDFRTINGVPRLNVGRLLSNGSVDFTFDPGVGVNQWVRAMTLWYDGRVIIAGGFTRVNGVARNRVARLHPNGSVDLTFDPGPGPSEAVEAVALAGAGRLLIGGAFTSVAGLSRGRVARLNHDGSVDPIFNPPRGGADSTVTVVKLMSDALGRVLIGGAFQKVNTIPRPFVARLFGGAPSAQAPVIVRHPSLADDVSAGEDVTFTVIASAVPAPQYQWQRNGVAIPGATNWLLTLHNVRTTNNGTYTVAVFNGLGSVISMPVVLDVEQAPHHAGAPDIAFYSGAGPNDRVTSIAIQSDGRVVVGGAFTEFDGLPRHRIARLERDGALDQSFNPGSGANDVIQAVVVQPDGRVLIGGAFMVVNGIVRPRIARLNSDGSVDATFDPELGPDGEVMALALLGDGRVLVGGSFLNVNGVSRAAIVRLTVDGALDPTFSSPWAGGSVAAIQPQTDGTIFVGGALPSTNAFSIGCARLTATGEIDPTFQSVPANSSVDAVAVQDINRVLVGGFFTSLGGFLRSHIARLNITGAVDFGFTTTAADVVRAITLQRDGRVLVGGDFRFISGRPYNRIARLETNGFLDFGFLPGSGVTNDRYEIDEYGRITDTAAVYAIALEAEGRILIGGDFTHVNGLSRPFIARLYDRQQLSTIQIRYLPNSEVELSWDIGVLEQAAQITGPWADVAGAASPYRVLLQGSLRFFRLRLN